MSRKRDVAVAADEMKCTGCLICELRCSLRFEKAFNPVRSAIQVRRLAGGRDKFRVSFSDACDNCGICVRFCPYEALA